MPWYPDRARCFLDNAAHERAADPGMSDTTLDRLAALSAPESSTTKAAFVRALTRAGWGKRRISAAVRAVQTSPPAPSESLRACAVRLLRGVTLVDLLILGIGAYAIIDAFRFTVVLTVLAVWAVLFWPARKASAKKKPRLRVEVDFEGGSDNRRYLRVVGETKRLLRGEEEPEAEERESERRARRR